MRPAATPRTARARWCRRLPPTKWVVSLGDSYIAGEGDRWAGNSAADSTAEFGEVDALGPFAYAGKAGLEDIPGCHRATLPEVAVDYGDVRGENFACSGAETSTKTEGDFFKPGIDFYDKGSDVGQALALERFAKSHDVTAVVLSIGGNDFDFGAILTQCVEDFFLTAGGPHTYCSQDPKLAAYFTPSYQADVQKSIAVAIGNITTAMKQAGRKTSDYRIIVQNYPSPVPAGRRFPLPADERQPFRRGRLPTLRPRRDAGPTPRPWQLSTGRSRRRSQRAATTASACWM